jgi:hypothetical protein
MNLVNLPEAQVTRLVQKKLTHYNLHATSHKEQSSLSAGLKLGALLACRPSVGSSVLVDFLPLIVDALAARVAISLAVLHASCGRVTKGDDELAILTAATVLVILLDDIALT